MAHELVLAAAFSSGVAVAVSPCATALLPAYLSYYLSRSSRDDAPGPEEPSRMPTTLIAGLVGLVAGFGLLVTGFLAFVLSFNVLSPSNLALFIGGGLAAALGGFFSREGIGELEPSGRALVKHQLKRGLLVGVVASLGIAAVYVALGGLLFLAVSTGLRGFQGLLPWVAFVSAGFVVVLGILMFFGKEFPSFLPRLRAPRGRRAPAFFLFGVGYGLIATGCFFPVFVSVFTAALTLAPGDALQVFLVYALGSAAVFILITLSASAAQSAAFRALRRWRPYVHRVGGALVVAMGAYVLWFDWTYLLSRGL